MREFVLSEHCGNLIKDDKKRRVKERKGVGGSKDDNMDKWMEMCIVVIAWLSIKGLIAIGANTQNASRKSS